MMQLIGAFHTKLYSQVVQVLSILKAKQSLYVSLQYSKSIIWPMLIATQDTVEKYKLSYSTDVRKYPVTFKVVLYEAENLLLLTVRIFFKTSVHQAKF